MRTGSAKQPLGVAITDGVDATQLTSRAPWPSQRLRLSACAFLAVAATGVLVHAAHASLFRNPQLDRPVADWLYCSLFGLAALACALRAARERRDGGNARAWAIAAAGVTLWAAAEISYRVLEPDPGASYPLQTQGLLLVSFGLASITLVLLSRDRIDGFHKGLALDGLIGGLAIAAVAASLLFGVGAGHSVGVQQPTPPALFLLADLGILAFVVVTIALTGWRPGPCWGLMCAGILVNTMGNIALVQASAAGTFHRGSLVDTLYVSSVLLLGLAAWYPIRPAVRRHADDVRRVAAPLAFAFLALGLLVFAAFAHVNVVAIVLATATLALVGLRTAIAFRENRDLLEARQRDALTDGLTGLGNRRMLMRALERALDEVAEGGECSFLLFDLDGFKSYNDAFGHPAGDALLVRLAHNLRGAVEPHGSAYRMGGDEFCAIVKSDRLKAEAILAGACEALSESGSGFAVRPSYGAVVLGNEVDTVAQALQVADQRMYSRKHGRAGSVIREARVVLLRVLQEREPGLDAHLHAVARLAREVGAELRLGNEELDVLTRAAELHDIGKMATPDAILHKPGPLSAEEWEIMRRHTVIGERILNSVPALRPIGKVVRSTHERIDGRGYPDGLAGEDIPLPARVIAVCDAYNAMTSERAYDRVKSHRDALAELRRCAGTQFDSRVVGVFCRIGPEPSGEPARDRVSGTARPSAAGSRPDRSGGFGATARS